LTRETLTRQLNHIDDEILYLGSMVEEAVIKAIETLKKHDTVLAHQIYDADRMINEKRFAIENAILILIATQQPMARDLRQLAAMLEIITELERMGDYAKGIAKVTLRLNNPDIPIPIRKFEEMTEMAISMLHRALSAFVAQNPNQAMVISKDDDMVDALYNEIYRILVDIMMADPNSIDDANLLMWVAHNLERLADRVTNICERTVFIATGDLFELDSDEDEEEEEEPDNL
jgi:phosphate transport system protein